VDQRAERPADLLGHIQDPRALQVHHPDDHEWAAQGAGPEDSARPS